MEQNLKGCMGVCEDSKFKSAYKLRIWGWNLILLETIIEVISESTCCVNGKNSHPSYLPWQQNTWHWDVN